VALIDRDTLCRFNYAIDRVLLNDLAMLEKFVESPSSLSDSIRQGFVNAGLGHVRSGTATTYVMPTLPLCEELIQYVLKGGFGEPTE
jgi:hypothetical protein